MRNKFRTQNLGLASWLRIAGHDCTVELDEHDPTKAIFVFPRDDEGVLDRHVADYHSSNACVDPLEFKQVETDLKRRMFELLDSWKGGGPL